MANYYDMRAYKPSLHYVDFCEMFVGLSPTTEYCNGLLELPKKVTSLIPSRRPFLGGVVYAQV